MYFSFFFNHGNKDILRVVAMTQGDEEIFTVVAVTQDNK